MKLIGPEGYSVLAGVNIFSSVDRSLFFHGSGETKGETSLEGGDCFVSKIESRKCGVLQYIILFVWRKWGENTNFVPWNCIFLWKTGLVSSVDMDGYRRT